MKTKILILWLVMLVLTVGVYAKTSQKMYSCIIPTDWSINDLYNAKWDCLMLKVNLIKEWNKYYQDNDDKNTNIVKTKITTVDNTMTKIDTLIKKQIPRSFR